MVSKCGNPACLARFRNLHEGRIFNIERSVDAGESASTGSNSTGCVWNALALRSWFPTMAQESLSDHVMPHFPQFPSRRRFSAVVILGNRDRRFLSVHTKMLPEQVCWGTTCAPRSSP